MATLGSALIYIRAVTDKLKSDLNSAERKVDGSATTMNNSLKKINWMAVGAAATAAMGVATVAIRKAIDAANEQEKVEARLEAVIRSTGKAAGFTSKEMFDMATGMQRVTTVGDEVILGGMAILATFKNIRGEAFERTTMAALDMAEVMQIDLRSAMVMLGKALNDPVTQMSALSRSGVTFTEAQKEMVKQLWLAGDTFAAQNVILDELESQFGGAATAARDTFGGAVTAAKNATGDLWEQLGFAITKNKEFIDMIKATEKALIEATPHIRTFGIDAVLFAKWLAELNTKGNDLYDTIMKYSGAASGMDLAAKLAKAWTEEQEELTEKVEETTAAIDFAAIAVRKKEQVWKDGYAAMSIAVKAANKDVETSTDAATKKAEDSWSYFYNQKAKERNTQEEQDLESLKLIKEKFEFTAGAASDNWRTHITDPSDGKSIAHGNKQLEEQALDSLAAINKGFNDTSEDIDETWNGADGVVAGFKKGMEEVVNYGGTMSEAVEDLVVDMRNAVSSTIGVIVDDLIEGSVNLDDAMQNLSSGMVKSLGNYATKMFDKVFDKLIDMIMVNLGLGTAESGVARGWAGAEAATIEMAKYGAAATTAILTARTIRSKFAEGGEVKYADGGWMSRNPCGGPICEGSGVYDDVFLGTTPGVNHWAMGGEFVVNKKATAKYRPLLEEINSNRGYADGGLNDFEAHKWPWEPTADGLAIMTGLSFLTGLGKGGPIFALGQAGATLIGVIAASFAAKNLTNLFADGGPVPGYANQGHGFFGDIENWDGSSWNFPGIPDDLVGDVLDGFRDGNIPFIKDDWLKPSYVWDKIKNLPEKLWDYFYDCVKELINWEELQDFVVDLVRSPLKQVSKDLIDPDQMYPNALGILENIFMDLPKILFEFLKTQTSNVVDFAGCLVGLKSGTDYVPRDGAYYLHQGEAVVPANENLAAGSSRINITFVNRGIISTNDVDAWFAERFERIQSRKLGIQYQPIRTDEIGLSL